MQTQSGESLADDVSPDSADRIADFLSRHGGPGRPARHEILFKDVKGWSEVYAADGHILRCDWSRTGSREEMSFAEIAPISDDAPSR